MSPSAVIDALVVGGGPAGLSAALVFARQNQTAVVFSQNKYRNEVADYMHLVPGLDHIAPSDFRAAAWKQLDRYKTITQVDHVNLVKASQLESGLFSVQSDSGQAWTGKKLILASGVEDVLPDVPGYAECWGKSIFHCLYCKGWEQRGRSAGILATGPLGAAATAMHTARQASALSEKTVLYTDGNEELSHALVQAMGGSAQMTTDARKIQAFIAGPPGKGVTIRFEDGSESTQDYVAHQPPTKPRGPLIDQLGLEKTPSGDVKVSVPFQQTNVRGIFAAGDNCAMLKNVPNAIFSGHVAGQMASMQLLAELHGQKPLFPV